MLLDPPDSTRNAQDKAGSAYDAFCEEDIKYAVQFMSNVIAPGARGHIFC